MSYADTLVYIQEVQKEGYFMQTLFPKDFPEGVTFVRTYTGTGCIHIGELPGGGFSRIDGQPIQDVDELRAVIPQGPHLQKALAWWEHRGDEAPEDEPPAVMWRKGQLVYVESGAVLTSHAEIIQAFPEEGSMQRAALEWFGQRQHQQYQAKQRQDLQTGVLDGHPEAVSPPDNHPAEYHAGRQRRAIKNVAQL